MFYLCMRCGCITAEPKRIMDEETGYIDLVCPDCLAEQALDFAANCRLCGCWFPVEHYNVTVCDQCRKVLAQKFEAMLERNFTMIERSILNEIYEGVEF